MKEKPTSQGKAISKLMVLSARQGNIIEELVKIYNNPIPKNITSANKRVGDILQLVDGIVKIENKRKKIIKTS